MKIQQLFCRFLPVLILLIGFAAPQQAYAQKKNTLTDAEVADGIEKIKKYLYDTQDPATGGWYGAHHAGPKDAPDKNSWGPTAMAALALIVSGESPQNPAIAKALKLLGEVEIQGVYALSMRTHLWSYLPQDVYGGALAKDARTMLQTAYGKSRFNYYVYGTDKHNANDSRIDNSTTQYGLLAMWQASKRGMNINKGFWVDAIESFLSLQSDVDGGWAYSGNRNTSQTMTCAGLTCLYVAQQELFRDQSKPNAEVQAAINKGMEWLDKNFGQGGGGHGGGGYMYYGYERVALASGRKYFGGKDWFKEFATKIIQRNGKYGNSVHEAAFCLMFLARGGVPVWINKLEIPGAQWNNRPNDVYFLNRFISGYREHEVNWQTVSTETEPEDWISAPLMWISSDEDIDWTPDQVAKIKKYIDLGGTVIGNPESRSNSFRNAFEALGTQMYPGLKFEPMDPSHPMANLLVGDPRGKSKPDFRVLSNGARVLMVMPLDDWGMTFQSDKNPDPEKTEAWRDIVNIYGVVTDRGSLTPRLSTPLVARENKNSTGTIKVVIPQWEDPAGAMPEHDVYAVMRNYMNNETGKQLLVERLPLASLGEADPSLLHLVGVDAVEIKPGEREAIQAYIQAGGTVLIENLGGKGKFAQSIRDQLGPMFPGDENKVSGRSDIITGRNLPDGSKNNRRLIFRRMVLERANPDAALLLRGYAQSERYPVLLSYEDLSLGMLGVKQYGINGYAPETARDMMLNILLEANKVHAGSTEPTSGANAAAAAE